MQRVPEHTPQCESGQHMGQACCGGVQCGQTRSGPSTSPSVEEVLPLPQTPTSGDAAVNPSDPDITLVTAEAGWETRSAVAKVAYPHTNRTATSNTAKRLQRVLVIVSIPPSNS